MSPLRIDRRVLRELERSPELRGALEAAARTVAEGTEAVIGPGSPVRVSRVGTAMRVTNARPSAAVEEWGSASREPLAPLRRGVRAAGLRLDED